jgi:hypothetical protein
VPLISTGNECGESADLSLLLTFAEVVSRPTHKINNDPISRCDESNTTTVTKSSNVVRILPGLIVLDEYRLAWTTKAVVTVYHLASHKGAFNWSGMRVVHDDI